MRYRDTNLWVCTPYPPNPDSWSAIGEGTTSVQTLEVLVVDPASPPIYWTDAEKIKHVNLDGSNVEDLVTGLDEPIGIALDVSSSKMYWVDFGTQKIQRSNLDGSNVEYIGAGAVSSIALDVTGGKIYWTTRTTASNIRRANLDGSNVEDLVIRGLNAPNGIALDIQGGKMYWTDGGADKIQRANLDGSNVEDIVTGLSTPRGITLDAAKAKMYWTDGGADKIQRANLDGSNVEDLVTGVSDPYGITLDAAKAKMYWTEREAGKIQRANLDGSNVEDIVTGLDRPFGIALGILYQNRAPVFSEGASTTRTVAEDTGAGVNIGSAVSATDADNDTLTYTLSGTDATSFDIVSTSGQLQTKATLDYETKTSYTVTVTVSDGTLTDSITVTITVTDVTEETVTASTRAPLTEATVDESVVTLTLTGGTYEQSIVSLRNNVTVSGIAGVTAKSSAVRRVNDTVVTVELAFDGTDFDTDATLTFTVGADAIAGYSGAALTATLPVTALTESVTASSPQRLTEATLNGSVVTLTLNNGVYESLNPVRNNLTVSGITGVRFISSQDVVRVSDTKVTISLRFNGNIDTDATLTFTVGAGAIANYNGSALTAILPVTAVEELTGDINEDGVVNIQDLVLVAGQFGQSGQNSADVNKDGVVNIQDLVLVAGAFGNTAAAPALRSQALAMLTPTDVQGWLAQARGLALTDAQSQRGIIFLEQLLSVLIPKETALLPNYPNPFNPETWIPYRLAKDAFVTVTIYDQRGRVVRDIAVGHRIAAVYESRSKAIYWDGRTDLGERVASGIYFYTLTAGDYTATRKMVILK